MLLRFIFYCQNVEILFIWTKALTCNQIELKLKKWNLFKKNWKNTERFQCHIQHSKTQRLSHIILALSLCLCDCYYANYFEYFECTHSNQSFPDFHSGHSFILPPQSHYHWLFSHIFGQYDNIYKQKELHLWSALFHRDNYSSLRRQNTKRWVAKLNVNSV